jgi:hypothetical protein
MKALKTMMTGAAAAAALGLAAAPAQAQYYDYRYDNRDNTGRVVAGIAAAVGAVAVASAVASQGRWGHDPRVGWGHDRGFERHAVQTCSWEADRRLSNRWGRARVDVRDVQWLRNGRIRVLGAAEIGGRHDRWDRRYAVDRRAFTCEVDRNGRVRSFRTHNYRW